MTTTEASQYEDHYDDTLNHLKNITTTLLILAVFFSLLSVVVLESVAFGDLLNAPNPADDFVTVFRGDRPGTRVIKSKAAREGGYAHSQRVIDEGDLDDLFIKHQDSSDIPPSPFISVSTDRRVAEFFAGRDGVVNEFRIPRSRATPNRFNNKLVPGPDGKLIPEQELLVPNYIRPSEFVRPRPRR